MRVLVTGIEGYLGVVLDSTDRQEFTRLAQLQHLLDAGRTDGRFYWT